MSFLHGVYVFFITEKNDNTYFSRMIYGDVPSSFRTSLFPKWIIFFLNLAINLSNLWISKSSESWFTSVLGIKRGFSLFNIFRLRPFSVKLNVFKFVAFDNNEFVCGQSIIFLLFIASRQTTSSSSSKTTTGGS